MTVDPGRPSFRVEHVTDAEIDAYWGGRLPDEDVRRIEEHYLACQACHARVDAAEHSVDARPVLPEEPPEVTVSTWWRLATAVLAAACVVLGGLWMRASDRERTLTASNAVLRRSGDVAARPGAGVAALRLGRTRDAAPPASLPATAAIIGLSIDVSDVGERLSRFDVSVRRARSTSAIAMVFGLVPSEDRRIIVPVSGALLPPGDYRVLVMTGSATSPDLDVPFSITAR